MSITSVPSVSSTQLNQTSIAQSGGGFQDASVTNDNTASQYIDAPIWAGGYDAVLSAPRASNTQLNLADVKQAGGYDKYPEPGFQFADVTNDNTAHQDVSAPLSFPVQYL